MRCWHVLGTFIVAVSLIGCEQGSDTSTEPPAQGPATLSGDVQPILSSSCAFNGCHGGSILEPPGKPMSLDAGKTYSNTVNVPALELPSMHRIEPGNPDASYLVQKIQGTQGSVGGTGERMPLGLPPLSQAEIDVIREWIANGAKNN